MYMVYLGPTDSKYTNQKWTWLILVGASIGGLVLILIVVICLRLHCKKWEKRKAREKKILIRGAERFF